VLGVEFGEYRVSIGTRFSVSFQRAKRAPDGQFHPPPSSLGVLAVHRVADYAERLPAEWNRMGAGFLPIYPQEAVWLGFSGAAWKPNAVTVGAGRLNAVTGRPWEPRLHDDPQNYMVCPPQLSLDGIYAGDGIVKQFVAAHPERGSTGASLAAVSAMQIVVYEPKAARFPEAPPARSAQGPDVMHALGVPRSGDAIELADGATIAQEILRDPCGIDTWDQGNYGSVAIHLLSGVQYREITGLELPPPLSDAQGYTGYRLP